MRKLITVAFLAAASHAWAAFGYYSPISINASQVAGTLTDFPVLVNVTDARFKTVANGGHVQNSSGFDIRPYTNSGLGTAISGYELERYNASTGEVVMWVKVSSLASSTTPFVLAYGDSGISTDGSSSTTWSSGFLGVYHLKDGTTLDVNSATGSNNGTNHSATATAGEVDGAAAFVTASSQYVDLSNGMNPSPITITAWVKATTFANSYNAVVARFGSGTNYAILYVKSNGKLSAIVYVAGGIGNVGYDGAGSNTLSTGTWYYVGFTYNAANNVVTGYVNGASDFATTVQAAATLVTTAAPTRIGNDTTATYWNGAIDEARVSSVTRTTAWIGAEYQNQSVPGTFETLGTEVNLTASSNGFFYFFP